MKNKQLKILALAAVIFSLVAVVISFQKNESLITANGRPIVIDKEGFLTNEDGEPILGARTTLPVSSADSLTFNGITYTWPPDNGDSGEQLQTNGSGTLTWENSGAFDATAQDALTWSDAANASNLWTFDLSGIDPTLNFIDNGFDFTGNVSVSAGFEAIGYASASQYYLNRDGSAIDAVGAFTFGGGDDAAIRFDGTDFIIETQVNSGIRLDAEDDTLEFYGSGNLQWLSDLDGIDLITGNAFLINNTSVLNATTLGTGVVNASLDSIIAASNTLTVNNAATDLFSITGTASISSNFEVGGFASVSTSIGVNAGGTIDTLLEIGGEVSISNNLFLGPRGVILVDDGDGALLITGRGNGSDENLTLNLDDNADTWLYTTSTGVTVIDYSLASMTLHLGTAGVSLSEDGDGAITFTGRGDGDDEAFTINLDDTANTAVWSSTTGLNLFDFGTIGLNLEDATLEVPNSSNPTLTNDGDFAINTASTQAGIVYQVGSTDKAIHDPCKTYYYATPDTAGDTDFGVHFNDPFTITEVYASASDAGSLGVTWNLTHGGNDLFTTDKLASAAFTYTTGFNDATIDDGSDFLIQIVSKSADTLALSLTWCGYYPK